MAGIFDDDGQRLTDCCGAVSTYHDDTLCCKKCWKEVPIGQGDGTEVRGKPDAHGVTITIPGTPEKRYRIPAPPDAAGAVGDYRQIEERRGGAKR